ncbi:MAG: LacI family transcriptional regulator [Gaiellaceae bacterium]|nr:LacI family transcriptional regulator [Gaiellaceae bacterium]
MLDLSEPTLLDVAREAGVSIASASRVLNGMKTRDHTAERVHAAAEHLGYLPNRAARSLRSRRTGFVTFLTQELDDLASAAIASGLEAALQERGLHLLLQSALDSDDIANSLRSARPDAAVIRLPSLPSVAVDQLRRLRTAVAAIGTAQATVAKTDYVIVDEQGSASLAVCHLYGAGRRRIGYLQGSTAPPYADEHAIGFREGHERCGSAGALFLTSSHQSYAPRDAAAALINDSRVDALICADGAATHATLAVMASKGLSAPDHIAVVTLAGPGIASGVFPELTSVDPGWRQAGRMAADLVSARIAHPARKLRTLKTEPLITVRASTAAQ